MFGLPAPHPDPLPAGGERETKTSPDTSFSPPAGRALKLQGGRAPFRWLANGRMLPDTSRRRTTQRSPDGDGYSTLTVIDAMGQAAGVRVFVE